MSLFRYLGALIALTASMYLFGFMGVPSQMDKACAATSLTSSTEPTSQPSTPETVLRPVQLFDVRQERVIKTFTNNDYFQQAAKEWLRAATKLSPQLNIGNQAGYIVRVPLKEPYTLQINQLQIVTKDVFMVYYVNKSPLLLLFSPERKAFLIETNTDARPFMERLLTPTGSGAARE